MYKLLAVSFLSLFTTLSFADSADQHSQCDSSNKSKFYVLDLFAMSMGTVSTTEVSILAKGKKVCFHAVATARNDGTDTTEAVFDDGRVSCTQKADKDMLEAAQLRKTGYRVIGQFSGVKGSTVQLKNCSNEKL